MYIYRIVRAYREAYNSNITNPNKTYTMAKKTTGANVGKAVAIGASIAAIGAAAYLLFGPEGKKHQKNLKTWMIRMKADVMEKMEEAQDLTAPVYEKIVSEVEQKYKAMKNIDGDELKKEIDHLKKNWRAMMKSAKAKKPAAKASKKK